MQAANSVGNTDRANHRNRVRPYKSQSSPRVPFHGHAALSLGGWGEALRPTNTKYCQQTDICRTRKRIDPYKSQSSPRVPFHGHAAISLGGWGEALRPPYTNQELSTNRHLPNQKTHRPIQEPEFAQGALSRTRCYILGRLGRSAQATLHQPRTVNKQTSAEPENA